MGEVLMSIDQPHFTPWTPEQNELLARLFPDPCVTPAVMEQLLGKSWSAIKGRAHRMRLRRPKSEEWTSGELAKLMALYPDVEQTPQSLEQHIGRSWNAIRAKAHKLCLTRPSRWSTWEDKLLGQLYVNERIPRSTIEHQLGRPWSTIQGRAQARGLQRPRPNRFHIRKDYFHQIDCDEKAYFLGLIAADGSVAERGTLDIELQLRDAHLVEKLRDAIAPGARLKKRHGLRLLIQARSMTDDLARYGVVPRKSYTFGWPTALPEAFVIPFLLGYFDGDGSLRRKDEKNGWGWELLGCHGFLEVARFWIETHVGITIRPPTRAVKDRSPHLFRLQVTGTRVLAIDRVLNASGLGLRRKHHFGKEGELLHQ
jgi:hypothetical protein